jgi:hypothetical protein
MIQFLPTTLSFFMLEKTDTGEPLLLEGFWYNQIKECSAEDIEALPDNVRNPVDPSACF